MLTRRNFLGILAAPAIIKTAGLLMPVKQIIVPKYYGAVTGRWSSLDLEPPPPGSYHAFMRAVDVVQRGLVMHIEIKGGPTLKQVLKL